MIIGDYLDLYKDKSYPCSDGSSVFTIDVDALVEAAQKEGREQVKTWMLNHLCHIRPSGTRYVYLGAEYIRQCLEWDNRPSG